MFVLATPLTTLDFYPRHRPSRLHPPLIWNQIQISGFDSDLPPNLCHEPLPSLLLQLYPELSFVEFACLISRLDRLDIDTKEVFDAYQFRDSEALQPLLDYVMSLPKQIQTFLTEKQFHQGDIRRIFPSASCVSEAQKLLSHCVKLKMSKSQVLETCEMGNELFEIDGDLLIPDIEREKFMAHIKALRFPISTSKDSERAQNIKLQNWPLRTQVRWQRLGDLAGLEVKFFVTSAEEFKRILKDFDKVQAEEIWNNHSLSK
jgi:hypothetical protein